MTHDASDDVDGSDGVGCGSGNESDKCWHNRNIHVYTLHNVCKSKAKRQTMDGAQALITAYGEFSTVPSTLGQIILCNHWNGSKRRQQQPHSQNTIGNACLSRTASKQDSNTPIRFR